MATSSLFVLAGAFLFCAGLLFAFERAMPSTTLYGTTWWDYLEPFMYLARNAAILAAIGFVAAGAVEAGVLETGPGKAVANWVFESFEDDGTGGGQDDFRPDCEFGVPYC